MQGQNIIEKLNSAIILNRMNIVALMQTLQNKGIITREEMQSTRDAVMKHPRYRDLMDNVKDLENMVMNNPEEIERLLEELKEKKIKKKKPLMRFLPFSLRTSRKQEIRQTLQRYIRSFQAP